MSNDKQNRYENHPIQLISLKVLELSIKVIPEHVQLEPNVENFSLFHGHSEYDSKDKSIAVRIGIEMDQDELPFELRVEILGIFEVDEDQFPLKFINNWAEKNAPLILYPYLREHVFSLSTRAGFGGTLLPLFQMPTFYSKYKP